LPVDGPMYKVIEVIKTRIIATSKTTEFK
jgi:hypothetical protein